MEKTKHVKQTTQNAAQCFHSNL